MPSSPLTAPASPPHLENAVISEAMKSPAFLAPLPLNAATHSSLSRRLNLTNLHQYPRAALATPPPPLRPPNHGSTPDRPPSPALPLLGREALDDVLLSTAPDTLVVVMFHARWCRVCKTLTSKLPRVAVDYPGVVWRTVDFAELSNKPLCEHLGVKLLPTFRFYRGGMSADGKPLDQFTTGPFGVKRLVDYLDKHRDSFSLDM